jgi:hypothetical protein
MPILTRRHEKDRHQENWQVYYGDVRIGWIGERAGAPKSADQWGWTCGFHPRDRHLSGTAGSFDQARADFEAAWRALEVANILGVARKLADVLVQRFLDPEPPLLDGTSLPVSEHIAAICTLASATVSKRCFARFRELRGRLPGGITSETDDLLNGAENYAKEDFVGAARLWRPLLRGPRTLVLVLPGAMAEVFGHTGNPELAEQVDKLEMDRAGEFNGATLGHVRAAQRAFRQGDHIAARRLAKEVVAAWQVADEMPPAIVDMQRLLKQLPEQ